MLSVYDLALFASQDERIKVRLDGTWMRFLSPLEIVCSDWAQSARVLTWESQPPTVYRGEQMPGLVLVYAESE